MSKQAVRAILALLVSPVALGAAGDRREVRADAQRFYAGRSGLHRRVNGVLLKAQMSAHPRNNPTVLQVGWTVDYTGARQPLVILKPSTTEATGQTRLIVYAEDARGRPHQYTIHAPTPQGMYVSKKQWFVTVPKGESASGVIRASVADVRSFFLKHWPDRFDAKIAPRLSIQLVHAPTDRGEAHNLDAWTGQLWSKVLKVDLKSW